MDISTALLSLPTVVHVHLTISDILRACGGTYQSCICAFPFLARKQGLVTVTCDPRSTSSSLVSTIILKVPRGRPCSGLFLRKLKAEASPLIYKTCCLGSLLIIFAAWLSEGIHKHASLQRFILPEVLWKLKRWFRFGLEVNLSRSLVHMAEYLSNIVNSLPEDSKHVVADDILSDGTFVQTGSSVTYSIYSVGRTRSTWGDDCLEFRPKGLAYLQMKSAAAAALLRHKLTLMAGYKVEQKMSLTGYQIAFRNRDSGRDIAVAPPSETGFDGFCGGSRIHTNIETLDSRVSSDQFWIEDAPEKILRVADDDRQFLYPP
ncbi:Cytochrome P450 86A8 [Hibiscus syriacus]|uniref:Cytochrome P450 86A8 n=1 Tax=Hibiscus syriacus TaxID=106335 RepID=A0A6A3A1T6_HIBSY|nr:Cytochrome P450 86A8 [Hibiscus syriacus]